MSTPVLRQLYSKPSIHNDSKSNQSLLSTPTIPRKVPKKRKVGIDELVLFQPADKIVDIDSIAKQNSPESFAFKRTDSSVQFFNLKCNEETGILAAYECISVDRNLHVRLSYHGLVIPFPKWF